MSEGTGRRNGRVVYRRVWLILAIALIGAGAGYAIGVKAEPMYRASTTLLVGRPLTEADLNQDTIDASQRLAATYADLVTRQPILEGTVQQLGLGIPWESLRGRVQASVPRQDTPLIQIDVTAPSPEEATVTATAITQQVIALSPTTSEDRKASEVQAFVRSRLNRLQHTIARLEARNTGARSELATATGERLAALRVRIGDNETQILDLQADYASLLSFISSGGVSNYLEVLEQAEAGSDPVRPDLPVDLAAGAGIGLTLGLVVAYLLRDRRRGRGHGVTSAAIASGSRHVTGRDDLRPVPAGADVGPANGASGPLRHAPHVGEPEGRVSEAPWLGFESSSGTERSD